MSVSRRTIRIVFAGLAVVAVLAIGWQLWPSAPLPASVKADRILVLKSERRLLLMRKGKTLKAYRISLGFTPDGHKAREGDGRTPEGLYRIDYRKANSNFHRALHISYPNRADRRRARKAGRSPGGAIMIHGIKNGFGWIGTLHRLWDWTNGCIAVTDREIREIWRSVPNGTPIEIRK